MREKRSEHRLMCADLVNVEIRAGSKRQQRMVANLEDISPSGACLQLDAAVRKGASVDIICATCRLKGKVRHCRFMETGYNVGVKFDKRNSWDRQLFEPKHLLDIPVLVQGGRADGCAGGEDLASLAAALSREEPS